jgi:hypothetical protein
MYSEGASSSFWLIWTCVIDRSDWRSKASRGYRTVIDRYRWEETKEAFERPGELGSLASELSASDSTTNLASYVAQMGCGKLFGSG